MNVLVTPNEDFDEVKSAKASVANWLVPAVLLIVIGWIGAGLIISQPALQQQMNEMAEKNIEKEVQKQHLPSGQAEQARQKGVQFAGLVSKRGAGAAPAFLVILTPTWSAMITWLGGH